MTYAIPSLQFNNATDVLQEGLRMLHTGETQFDFGALTAVDSATIAVMLAWKRAALPKSLSLQFLNAPPDLRNLASLYDLDGLLQLTPA